MGADSVVQRSPTLGGLAKRIDRVLPQTQCTRCGFPDCAAYAQAIAGGAATIYQCPPGGAEGVRRLSALTGQPIQDLDPQHGLERPRTVAIIDEAWCIGCTLCIQACPTDAIVGTNKRMHTVIEPYCTGCELCVPVCPVDCIALESASGNATGWAAWTPAQAELARSRYAARSRRLAADQADPAAGASVPEHAAKSLTATTSTIPTGPAPPPSDASAAQSRKAAIADALARARQRRGGG